MRGVMAIIGVLYVTVSTSTAQQPPTSPAFEVASVKPNRERSRSEVHLSPSGTLRMVNRPLSSIIAVAYDVGRPDTQPNLSRFTLLGGPSAVLSRTFDIEAKAAPRTEWTRIRAMLRTLLADRFELRIRNEVRRIPLYALTVSREGFGPGFRRSDIDCVGLIVTDEIENSSL
jgi:uncharacterized protein (TIGR03435 family)